MFNIIHVIMIVIEVSFVMKTYTDEEINLINSLCKPINEIDMNLINNIIDKMLLNGDYEELINFLNSLYDFAEIPNNIVDKLISENNKKCISIFLENEDILYFLTDEEKNRLKTFLNACEINVKLRETYDYYYKLLFKQGVRIWNCDSKIINDKIIEHKCTRYNKLINIKLKEVKDIGVIVSCIIYTNYNLSEEEQLLKEIDYINEFGFNIDRDINNSAIIKNL